MAVVWQAGIGWVDTEAKTVRIGSLWVNDSGTVYDSDTNRTMSIADLPPEKQVIANQGTAKAQEWLNTTPTPIPPTFQPIRAPTRPSDADIALATRGAPLPPHRPPPRTGRPDEIVPPAPGIVDLPAPIAPGPSLPPSGTNPKVLPPGPTGTPTTSTNRFINAITNWAQLNELDPRTVAEKLISNYEGQAGARFNQPYREFMAGRAPETYGLLTLRSVLNPDEERNFARSLGEYYEAGRTGEVDIDRSGRDLLRRTTDLFRQPNAKLDVNQAILRDNPQAQLAAATAGLRGYVAPTLRSYLGDTLDEAYRRYRSQGATGPATFLEFANQLGLY